MNNLTIKERCQALADGKTLEYCYVGEKWVENTLKTNVEKTLVFQPEIPFRIKPKPVKVFGIEIEGIDEPLKVKGMKINEKYYALNARSENGYDYLYFTEDNADKVLIIRGICWRKEEDIKKVVKALGLVE